MGGHRIPSLPIGRVVLRVYCLGSSAASDFGLPIINRGNERKRLRDWDRMLPNATMLMGLGFSGGLRVTGPGLV